MNATFTPKALKIVPVKYLDGVTQLSICDEHDIQICLVEIGKENYAPYLATAPEMYDCLKEAVKKVCIDSNCHAYNAGECMNAAGFCRAQKWINTLKKTRGEK